MSRSIVLAIDTSAAADRITDAITTAEGLRSFWTPDADAEPREGGALRFGFEEAPVDLTMRVGSIEAGSRVRWVDIGPWPGWQGTEVEWRVDDDGDHRTVVFTHVGWSDETPDRELGSVATTWAQVLIALRRHVETGEADPAMR